MHEKAKKRYHDALHPEAGKMLRSSLGLLPACSPGLAKGKKGATK